MVEQLCCIQLFSFFMHQIIIVARKEIPSPMPFHLTASWEREMEMREVELEKLTSQKWVRPAYLTGHI
jgi:hypothetical protein